MLSLVLAQLPSSLAGPNDPAYKGRVPQRALYAHPEAFSAIMRLERNGGLVYTDIFRGAAGQLAAKRAKPTSTKAVSLSAHGYGLAVDLDVDSTLKRRGWMYQSLLDEMGREGWYCHRRDRQRGSEDWHFNYLGAAAPALLPKADAKHLGTWDDPIEARIQQLYGAQLAPGDDEVRRLLLGLHLSARDFQSAWGLVADGIIGPMTRRTLAYVTAEMDLRGMFS